MAFDPHDQQASGISEKPNPESYLLKATGTSPIGIYEEAADLAVATLVVVRTFQLQKLPAVVSGPVPAEIVQAAWFEGFSGDDHPGDVVCGLVKLLEMQRQSLFDDGIYWVGGYGHLTYHQAGSNLSKDPAGAGRRIK